MKFEEFSPSGKKVSRAEIIKILNSQDTRKEEALSDEEIELIEARINFLHSAKKGAMGNAEILDIGNKKRAVWKTYEKFKHRHNIELAINRERATYVLSNIIGLGSVPPTVIRTIEDKRGSLQLYIEDAQELTQEEYDSYDRASMLLIDIFDYIIGNADRGENNNPNLLQKDGKLIPIDHGFAFANFSPQHFLRNQTVDVEVSQNIRDTLNNFLQDQERQNKLRLILTKLLPERESLLVFDRIKVLVEIIEQNGKIPENSAGILASV